MLRRRDDEHGARRFEDREIEMRRRHRIHAAEDLLILVAPAGIVDQPIDRPIDFRGRRRVREALLFELGEELITSRLEHLADAVQNLAPQIRRHAGPPGLRRTRRDDGVADILPRRETQISERLAADFGRVEPTRFGAREFATDVQLIRFQNRQPPGSVG